MPKPLIMVVCESVPTKLSGNKIFSPVVVSLNTTRAKYSKLTWCTMPEPGGTINILLNAFAPHLRNLNRSLFRSNSKFSFKVMALVSRAKSTWTEWSITKSEGQMGLMRFGSPPSFSTASRIAAKSTTAGTPVKSWRITRAGLNDTSVSALPSGFPFKFFQSNIAWTSLSVTWKLSQFRTADSNRIRIENGSSSKNELNNVRYNSVWMINSNSDELASCKIAPVYLHIP